MQNSSSIEKEGSHRVEREHDKENGRMEQRQNVRPDGDNAVVDMEDGGQPVHTVQIHIPYVRMFHPADGQGGAHIERQCREQWGRQGQVGQEAWFHRRMERVLKGRGCRRRVLDSVMDECEDQVGCEESEERCDVSGTEQDEENGREQDGEEGVWETAGVAGIAEGRGFEQIEQVRKVRRWKQRIFRTYRGRRGYGRQSRRVW